MSFIFTENKFYQFKSPLEGKANFIILGFKEILVTTKSNSHLITFSDREIVYVLQVSDGDGVYNGVTRPGNSMVKMFGKFGAMWFWVKYGLFENSFSLL